MKQRLVLAVCLVAQIACRKREAVPSPATIPDAAVVQAVARDAITALAQTVVSLFRRTISISAQSDDASSPALVVGKLSHEALQEAIAKLAAQMQTSPAALPTLLAHLSGTAIDDVDRLAFRELLLELPSNADVDRLLARLDQTLQRLEAELPTRLGVGVTRGGDTRPQWEAYEKAVEGDASAKDPMAEYASEIEAMSEGTRAGQQAWKDDPQQITGKKLEQKTVVLTFDDGPHARFSPAIIDILQRYRVPAVFFQVGRNVKQFPASSRSIQAAGHLLANHSFTHAFLPKLTPALIESQIGDTNNQLKAWMPAAPVLFRPPYGARNTKVLDAAAKLGMTTVLWNIDSLDWADPLPKSIQKRVLDQVAKAERGIILFHDIHERTVVALPGIIEALQQDGYQFASWDGAKFVVPEPARGTQVVPSETAAAPAPLFRESFAVVVGIDNYAKWPKLGHAVNDARTVHDVLIDELGFKPQNVKLLVNEAASRSAILRALGEDLRKVEKEDRVLVFFAGHGATRALPNGRDLGYIVPVEADRENYASDSISMTQLQDISDGIAAKHVFFVMDACYSGLALTRAGAAVQGSGGRDKYLREITNRIARQVLTAGGTDEQVADNGPSGHSIFTWTLLQGLRGKADMDSDGIITAPELAAYVGPGVSTLSRQTPAFGNLPGSTGGDFVFVLRDAGDYLSAGTGPADTKGEALNAELDKIRAEVAAERARNAQLQAQLDATQAQLRAVARGESPPNAVPEASNPLLESKRMVEAGMKAYNAGKFDDAAASFRAAIFLNPANVLAHNNLGFAYYKMGRIEDSVAWFEKTIALSPGRAVAYWNAGDAYAKLGQTEYARVAYLRYLELRPDSRLAEEVRSKIAALNTEKEP